MRIETQQLKGGFFLARATHGPFATACTSRRKNKAIKKAVEGMNGLLRHTEGRGSGQEVEKLSLFGVAVKEKNKIDSWEFDVVATSARHAIKVAVNAAEYDGVVNRENICKTVVWEKIRLVYS